MASAPEPLRQPAPGPQLRPEDPSIQPHQLFEILVREHEPRLRAFLTSLIRDPSAVEDLVQESFLVAWKNLDRYDRELPFGPWLRGIGRRLSMAWYRKKGGDRMELHEEATVEALLHLHEDFDQAPGDTMDEKLASLRACLSRLPDHQRDILSLHYEDELDCQSIADRVGKSREAVKKLLQRSRAWLGDCIAQRLEALGGAS